MKFYLDQFKSSGIDDPSAFVQCLVDAHTEYKKADQKRGCQNDFLSQIEEASANVFSWLNAKNPIPDVFPNSICFYKRDTQHLLTADISECLFQYSQRFRNQLKRAFTCKEVKGEEGF